MSIMYLLYVYWFYATCVALIAQALKCDPLDNVFYHKQLQECLSCKKCPVGLGKISQDEWNIDIDSINGISMCIPCRPCKPGTYSDVRAYHCKHCTNCTQKNMYELRSCNSKDDAVCDEKAPYPRTGSVKRDDDNNDAESPTSTSNSVSTAEIITIVLFVVVVALLAIGFGWRLYRKRNGRCRTLQTTESGEYGSHSSISYTPHNHDITSHLYNELQDGGRESSSEDDEQTPLISPHKQTRQRKRKRLLTYPFTEYSNEEDDLDIDVIETPNNNGDCRHSYPNLNIKSTSSPGVRNNVLDSGFADFTFRKEPHLILQSFNIKNVRFTGFLEKVKEWDQKYKSSKIDVKSPRAISPCSFLKEVKGQEQIVQTVKKWEEQEGLTSAFLSKVSRNLGPKYRFRSFAREAGLSNTDLTNIQQNYKDDVVEQGYQVLLKLKQKEVITKESDVVDVIQRLGFTDIIRKIRQ